jgi:cytochrome c oxidase subunit 2
LPVARFAQRGLVLLAFFVTSLLAGGASAQSSGGETMPLRPNWWLHKDVSTVGHEIDFLFDIILWMTLIVGVAVFIVLGAFLVLYRFNPNRHARYIHGNHRLEIVWTLIPALLMALTAAISQSTWAKIKNPPIGTEEGNWPTDALMMEKSKSGDVVFIEVVAQQFNWTFHYPGADGKLGPRRLDLIKKGTLEEGIGLDRSHPDAKDDYCTGMLVLPVNKKVYIHLTSVDVLHSFFLPNFRIKQDAVPGLRGKVWLEATKTSAEVMGKVAVDDAFGEQKKYFDFARPFDIVCAELCGGQHYGMRGPLFVVTQEQYNRYTADQQAKQAKANAASGGGEEY